MHEAEASEERRREGAEGAFPGPSGGGGGGDAGLGVGAAGRGITGTGADGVALAARPARGGLRTGPCRTAAGRRAARILPALFLVFLLSPAAPPAAATKVQIFETASRASFLAGTLDGVSVDSLGRLELAPAVERLTTIPEPFLLSAAVHPDGWVVGTGNAGRVLLVGRDGEVTELFAAPEPEVFAVWADPDGTVYAGTSPGGKVYRIPPGSAAPAPREENEEDEDDEGEASEAADRAARERADELAFFDPGETYIWALGRAADGALLVATGTQGRLYRVEERGGEADGAMVFDGEDTHLRSLETAADGSVLVGTAGEGLILRLELDGPRTARARTVHDADQPEVAALALGPDGAAYAALVASEASAVDLSAAGDQQDDEAGEDGEDASAAAVTAGSRRPGSSGPRSELVRISPDGVVESLWKLEDETLFDLAWADGRLWLGTGLEGKLYSFEAGEAVLEKDVDERQVVALLPASAPGSDGEEAAAPVFATTNAAALYRPTGGTERRGTYTSPTLDATLAARFGSLRWEGEVPPGGGVSFSVRSGMSSEPDRTWSDWIEQGPGRGTRRGGREGRGAREISLTDVPKGRYVQYRAELEAGSGRSPVLSEVELSYLQENLKPVLERIAVLDPGQVLVPANFNPASQVYEPAHPNREGIFTVLEAGAASDDTRLKPLWKRGFRSLRWAAEDPNDDELVYRVDFRPEPSLAAGRDGGPDAGEAEDAWLPVVRDLDQTWYSFDATVLPDGLYRFRVTASDAPGNVDGAAGTAERVSPPVTIDHSPPELRGVAWRGGRLAVEVEDTWSPIREAVVSYDAGGWEAVETADGLLDGRAETLLLDPPAGTRLVLLRLTDAAFNSATYDLGEAVVRGDGRAGPVPAPDDAPVDGGRGRRGR